VAIYVGCGKIGDELISGVTYVEGKDVIKVLKVISLYSLEVKLHNRSTSPSTRIENMNVKKLNIHVINDWCYFKKLILT